MLCRFNACNKKLGENTRVGDISKLYRIRVYDPKRDIVTGKYWNQQDALADGDEHVDNGGGFLGFPNGNCDLCPKDVKEDGGFFDNLFSNNELVDKDWEWNYPFNYCIRATVTDVYKDFILINGFLVVDPGTYSFGGLMEFVKLNKDKGTFESTDSGGLGAAGVDEEKLFKVIANKLGLYFN